MPQTVEKLTIKNGYVYVIYNNLVCLPIKSSTIHKYSEKILLVDYCVDVKHPNFQMLIINIHLALQYRCLLCVFHWLV